MECLFIELYEYNPPLKLLVSEGLFFCLSLMTNAIDCAKIRHKSYPRINYSYGRMRFKRTALKFALKPAKSFDRNGCGSPFFSCTAPEAEKSGIRCRTDAR